MTLAPASIDAAAAAFDAIAADYDRTFSHRTLGRWLRQAVHRRLHRYTAGDRVVELGCGTGEDALWLAQRGVRVVGLDGSEAMLSEAARKLHSAGVADSVRLQRIDLDASAPDLRDALVGHDSADHELFDGCLSNFGALNCVASRPTLAAAVAGVLRPGARLTVVVMGPVCAWEIASFALRGRLPSACRRLRGRTRAVVGGRPLALDYPTQRRLRRELEPWFRPIGARAIGVLLPPSQLAYLVDRHRILFDRLRRWEDRIAHLPPASWLSDHYLLELERR